MEIGSIFILLALVILIALFVARPFIERSRAKFVSEEEHEISMLMAERDRLINALQELDFDNTLGKIPAEDYPTQRALLLQQGADVLRKLDELMPSQNHGDAESRLESAIAARRADAAVGGDAQVTDDDLESYIASRRSERKERSAGFCPKCGRPVMRSDKFCPNCGKTL